MLPSSEYRRRASRRVRRTLDTALSRAMPAAFARRMLKLGSSLHLSREEGIQSGGGKLGCSPHSTSLYALWPPSEWLYTDDGIVGLPYHLISGTRD